MTGRLARRAFQELRREGHGRGRTAAALGVGVFIGCLPFYGLHWAIVVAAGWLLRLNRIKMYVAANISNPFLAPVLIFIEIQTGAWLQRRDFHDLTIDVIRNTDPWIFGIDLLLGSVVVGTVLGLLVAGATLVATLGARPLPDHIERTIVAAAERYAGESITAWEFARGKLRHDPIYRATIEELSSWNLVSRREGTLVNPREETPMNSGEGTPVMEPRGRTPVIALVDIGCGQGLTLALVAEAQRIARGGGWADECLPPPLFDRMIGIEMRARVAAIARRALGDDAEIVHGAAPDGLPPRVDAALLFDVLHLIPLDGQRRLMDALFARTPPGAVVLVREVDAAGGWRFQAVKFGNRVKNIAVGNWRQTFHFRSAGEWREFFAAQGWEVDTRPMGEGTPFANVLFRLVRPDHRV